VLDEDIGISMGPDQDQRPETEVLQTTHYRSEIDKAVDEKRLVE
jgi:hypothetical protein